MRDDLGDAILDGLNFCHCGMPENNLLYILGGLEIIDEKRPDDRTQFDAWWDAHTKREAAHFGNQSSAYFFYYWADKEGLTEHGGSVPGWLSDEGVALLTKLREWKATDWEGGEG